MRWHIGGKAHEKGGETEGVFGGDTELRLTRSEKDEMGMSRRPTSRSHDISFFLSFLRLSTGKVNNPLEEVDL